MLGPPSSRVRQAWVQAGLTQSQAARKMGIKDLAKYQRLEKWRYANPDLDTLARLKKVFPEISLDQLLE